MRPQKVTDEALIENLFSVIRKKGYDGASLQEFEKASGLKKASLYHRFPGGKKEITAKVLEHVSTIMKTNVIDTINDTNLKPIEKLTITLENIDQFYSKGSNGCLFESLSLDNGFELFEPNLNKGLTGLIASFEQLGTEFGFNKEETSQKAIETMILIQGSLVVSKIMNTTTPFDNSLQKIKKLYA